MLVSAGPLGLRVEIRPFVRTHGGRVRLAAGALLLAGASLFGTARLAQSWENGLRRGDFGDLPLPVLVGLTIAIAVSTPLAAVGLSGLAFAEEVVEISSGSIVIRTSAFERTRERTIPLEELECWRETYLPLAPWWTWAVKRLAARWRGRYEPIAGAAGPREKRMIGRILAQATGKPLLDDFGKHLEGSGKISR